MAIAAEFIMLIAIGIFLGVTGPYGTASEPPLLRCAFWLLVALAGGAIGIGLEVLLCRWVGRKWLLVLTTAAAMTPPITIIVLVTMVVVLGHHHEIPGDISPGLLFQVFVVSLFVMGTRAFARRRERRIVETVVAPPLPEAEAVFRRRLSGKRRMAQLLALEAYDHYVRVHTDAGTELISLRFSDAMAELACAHGYRVHRSWWVSAQAIEAGRWRRGSGELKLAGGLVVPVSRSGAPVLRAAGWL
jgi:DNA-binding LytR/AlgR family response regulator